MLEVADFIKELGDVLTSGAWAAIHCAFPELFDEDTVAKAAFVAGEYFNHKSALETA